MELDLSQFILSSRHTKKDDTCVKCGDALFGAGHFSVIAGPCAVEDYETTVNIARKVKESGALIFRAGAFKPRTSPYAFCGLREEGIKTLVSIKKDVGIQVVSEITDVSFLPLYDEIDVLQIGARSMQNFELLRAVGKLKKPVILKRGMGSTISELLQSAEYILSEGNPNVILCERGIRTFESSTRNTLDVSAIPLLKKMTHLPVIADPSHATGISELVPSVAMAAVAAGADGIMLEVHSSPEKAMSDKQQTISLEKFCELYGKMHKIREVIYE